MPLINEQYRGPGALTWKKIELVVYDGKIHLPEYPADGVCLVETQTKRIDKLCKVDQETRNVICNLKGYKGYLVVSYLTRKSDRETWGDKYSKSEYQFTEKRHEEICNQNKSVRVFDKSTNSFVWRPENYAKDVPEKFSVVLWAGTVGIGLKENGQTKELNRTKEEAWEDMILREEEKENPIKLVDPPKIPTVKTDGCNVVVIVIVSEILSLIGVLAVLAQLLV